MLTIRRITYILFLLVVVGKPSAKATHIVGGEITYEYIGNNLYDITMFMYFDCLNGTDQAIAIDSLVRIAAYSPITKNIHRYEIVKFSESKQIKVVNYSCIIGSPTECVMKRTYKVRMSLKDIPGGYNLAFQRCCRNTTIDNLLNAEDEGATFFTHIPERKTYGNNSSPTFDQLPPNFLCLGQPLSFKHKATDKDGDSLYYHLEAPYHGANKLDPQPDTPSTGPYRRVVYNAAAGYGVNNMVAGSQPFKINPITGAITCIPNRVGQFVVGIAVSEYRNGVLLSTTLRDFQLNVMKCEFDVVSAFSAPSQSCDKEVSFSNLSLGAVKFEWDFGDKTTTTDKSTENNPKYNYPKPGSYVIELVASSSICSDTFRRDIRIPHDSEFYAGPDTNVCEGKAVQIGVPWKYPGTTFKWTPGNYLSNASVSNPFASPPSSKTYVLRKTFDFCYADDTVNIRVGPPVPEFDFGLLEKCRNLAAEFENNSQFGTEYFWDFGTGKAGDTSTAKNPIFSYKKPGNYVVKLRVFLNGECFADIQKPVDVILDTIGFAGTDKGICYGDSVLLGQPNHLQNARYSWSPKATLNSFNSPMTWAKPEKTTQYIVTRILPECEVTDTVDVAVDKPEPALKLAYTAPCDGLNVKLYNKSKNCSQVKWDFGVKDVSTDTSTNLDSVSFSYPENGHYIINLLGISQKGCQLEYNLPLDVLTDTGLFAGSDTNLCLGQSYNLGMIDSISLAKFKWIPDTFLANDTISNPEIKPTGAMRYVVLKAYPECTFSDTVDIGVWDPLSDFKTDYDPHCDGFDINLTNLSERADEFVWDLDHEGGLVRDSSKIFKGSFPNEGIYHVSLYAFKEHCVDTITKQIKAYIDTGAFVIPDTVLCLADSILVGKTDTAAKALHFWTPGEGLSETDISNPYAFPNHTQVYVYERRFEKCTYFDTVRLRVADPKPGFDTLVYTACEGFMVEFENTSQDATNYSWKFSNGQSSEKLNEIQLFDFGANFKAELIAKDAHCAESLIFERSLRPFDDFEVIRPNVFTPNGDGKNDCYSIKIPDLPEDCHGFQVQVFNRWGQIVFSKEVNDNNYCWDGTNGKGVKMEVGTYYYMINVKGRDFHGALTLLY